MLLYVRVRSFVIESSRIGFVLHMQECWCSSRLVCDAYTSGLVLYVPTGSHRHCSAPCKISPRLVSEVFIEVPAPTIARSNLFQGLLKQQTESQWLCASPLPDVPVKQTSFN